MRDEIGVCRQWFNRCGRPFLCVYSFLCEILVKLVPVERTTP